MRDQEAFRDFWTVYASHYDEILAETMRAVDASDFAPVLRAIPPEEMERRSRESRELLEKAVQGEWAPYEDDLRMQGALYAKAGIRFESWYTLVGAFQRRLVPLLVDCYAQDPRRLGRALNASQEFVDRTMSMVAAEYLKTKEELLVRERERMEAARARSIELEAENRRIQEANRLKSEFLANMSHELRTPLNAILGFSQLLHDREVGPVTAQQEEFLGDILASGRHLLQLINDVLDLAKVESGKLEFRPEPVNLPRLAGEVVTILRNQSASKMVRVTCTVDPDLTDLVIDPARLKQVLYNYLSNALKFTLEGGSVSVRFLPEGGEAFRLEVEDTGPGIASCDLGQLFVEFQQLDGGTAKRYPGTGLGLALTRRLVEAQGGSVGVKSAVGKGSVFHAVLPRRSRGGKRSVEAIGRAGGSILVVEDQPADQTVLVQALEEAGYTVETAPNGAMALALARQRRFQAITLDLLLPDMSGLEVLAAIRNGSPNIRTPVVVVTVVAETRAVGGFSVQEVLPKPVDRAQLVAALERAGVTPQPEAPILLVDDDLSSLKLMGATLTQLGYRITSCPGAPEALKASQERPPLAVVLDLVMPGMDGFAFLDRFRTIQECREVPVLVWTMKDLSAEERDRLHASAQAVVAKGSTGVSSLLEQLGGLLPVNPARTVLNGGMAHAG